MSLLVILYVWQNIEIVKIGMEYDALAAQERRLVKDNDRLLYEIERYRTDGPGRGARPEERLPADASRRFRGHGGDRGAMLNNGISIKMNLAELVDFRRRRGRARPRERRPSSPPWNTIRATVKKGSLFVAVEGYQERRAPLRARRGGERRRRPCACRGARRGFRRPSESGGSPSWPPGTPGRRSPACRRLFSAFPPARCWRSASPAPTARHRSPTCWKR